jgi:hypothetical protein
MAHNGSKSIFKSGEIIFVRNVGITIVIIIIIIIGKRALFEPQFSLEFSARLQPLFNCLDFVTVFFYKVPTLADRGCRVVSATNPHGS